MSENAVKQALRRELRRLLSGDDFVERKIHGSMFQAGMPDHVVIANGRTSWVETKDVGKKLDPLQRVEFAKMERAGAIIFVGDDGPALAAAVAVYHRTGACPDRWPGKEIRTKKEARGLSRAASRGREDASEW